MNAPHIPFATWVALTTVAIGWFALATFVSAFGPIQHVVHFYELVAVLRDPSWLVHGIGTHTLEAFVFGTLSTAALLAPLGTHRLGTRRAYLLYLVPLALMVICGLILYRETGQTYVAAPANTGAVGAFLSHVANQVAGSAADTIARHVSLGAGAYVSFAAAVYLAFIGIRQAGLADQSVAPPAATETEPAPGLQSQRTP